MRYVSNRSIGRTIHKVYSSEALQAQQHVELYPPTEQIRLPQGQTIERQRDDGQRETTCAVRESIIKADPDQVLEFKHPYFRVDSKDDLDNIRRKAPAPRKAPATEDYSTQHHMSVISEQLTAQAQQVQHLQELYAEVSQTNKVLVNEVLTLNKMLHAQRQAQYEMLNHLTPFNGDSRNNGLMGQSLNGSTSAVSEADDPPELRRARELLSSVSTDSIADRELERLHGVYASPSDSSAMIPPAMPLMHDPMSDLNRYPVYPVGQTVGIDPFHSDHIHKIPYSLPPEAGGAMLAEAPVSQPLVNPTTPTAGQVVKPDSMWGPKKPNVFLVEDDPTCAKIGIKFLKSMGCEVEHAVSKRHRAVHVFDAKRRCSVKWC